MPGVPEYVFATGSVTSRKAESPVLSRGRDSFEGLGTMTHRLCPGKDTPIVKR